MHGSPSSSEPRSSLRARLPHALRISSIRSRLLLAFIMLVLAPTVLISASSVYVGLRNAEHQVVNQLESITTLKEEQIEAWLANLRVYIGAAIYPYQVSSLVEPLLTESTTDPAYLAAAEALRIQFSQLKHQTGLFEEIWLLDRNGKTLVSTNPANEGNVYALQEYFWIGLERPYTQSLAASTSQGLSSPVIVSQPVRDAAGHAVAVIVGRGSPRTLNEIMTQWAGLGATGETYLVGPNTILLTEPRFNRPNGQQILRLQSPRLDQVIQTRQSYAGLYHNYQNTAVIGTYQWLPDLQLVLVAEQAQTEAFAATYTNLGVNLSLAVLTVLIALFLARMMAHSIAAPLASLATTATNIANGDLRLRAEVTHSDEVGALALAFNRMTDRLRQSIGDLQQHVAELEAAEAEVRRVNGALARDITEQEALNHLSQQLQRCQSLAEAYQVSVPLLETLFAQTSGALYRSDPKTELVLVGQWGHETVLLPAAQQQRGGSSMQADWGNGQVNPPGSAAPHPNGQSMPLPKASVTTNNTCQHCLALGKRPILCVQLSTGGEALGLLQLLPATLPATPTDGVAHPGAAMTGWKSMPAAFVTLAHRAADLLALALANLQLRENLREQAIRDPLTGLFNRRFANEIMGPRLAEAQRRKTSMGLMLLDLDFFKQLNDTYGHDAGDAALRALGATLNRYTRAEDVACRFGGEEVLVIMGQISPEQAVARANELRGVLGALVIEHQGRTLPPLTASLGIALYPEHGLTHSELLIAADQALYHAKSTGRNRVCMAEAVLD